MGPGPASTKGWRHIQGYSLDCTSLACVLQGLGREECVDPSWFAEALLTPSLTFSACQAGWNHAAAVVPASTGILEQSEERGHQWEHSARLLVGTDAETWEPFPAPSSQVPPQAAQCHPVPRWELMDCPYCPLAEVSTLPHPQLWWQVPPPQLLAPCAPCNSQPLPSGLSPSLPLALWSSASPSSSGLSPLFHCHGSSCSWNRV